MIEMVEVGIALLWMWWFSRIKGYAFIASFLGFVAWAIEHVSTTVVVHGTQMAKIYGIVMTSLRAWTGTVLPLSVLAFVLFWSLRGLHAINRWWETMP
jgi:hypothetical protein